MVHNNKGQLVDNDPTSGTLTAHNPKAKAEHEHVGKVEDRLEETVHPEKEVLVNVTHVQLVKLAEYPSYGRMVNRKNSSRQTHHFSQISLRFSVRE